MNKNLVTKMYVLMTLLVIAWGFEYVIAKRSLSVFDPFTLAFFKYAFGLIIVFGAKMITDRKSLFRRKDLPLLVVCAILGDIGYFALEYNAMYYIPVTLVAVIAGLVPVLSVIVERVIFKKKINAKIIIGMAVSILALFFIVGFDYKLLLEGRLIGYLLAFGCVFAWNVYNFTTARLAKEYSAVSLTFYQMVCALAFLLPYTLRHMPPPELLDAGVWSEVVFLGIVPAGFGFIIYVKAIDVIGVTPTSMFVNFVPVSTAVLGWAILKEHIGIMQIIAGIVVVVAACVVIREKGRLNQLEMVEGLELTDDEE